MATSLAAQLAALQKAQPETTSSILDPKRLKKEHSVSLLFPPSEAISQDYETIYSIAIEGFEELCSLDPRFAAFERSLFSEQSKDVDRETLPKEENRKLNEKISLFLELVGGWVLVKSGQKALEWLIRRFRVHHHNTALLLLIFLPYHQHPIFLRVLSIVPKILPADFNFLTPYRRAVNTPVARAVILQVLTQSPPFFKLVSDHVISVVNHKHSSSTLVRFWGGISLETLGALLDRAVTSGKSGFTEEDVVQRFLPVISDGLEAGKKNPEFQIGTYMLLSLLALRTVLEEKVSVALMGAITATWSGETIVPAIASLSLLAQQMGDNAPQIGLTVAVNTLKVTDIAGKIVELGEKYRADKLCAGLCVAFLNDLGKFKRGSLKSGLELVKKSLASARLLKVQKKAILHALLAAVTKESGGEEFVGLIEDLKTEPIFQEVLLETDTDIEVLELRLGMVLMGQPSVEADNTAAENAVLDVEVLPDVESQPEEDDLFRQALSKLPGTYEHPSFLVQKPGEEFSNIARAFLTASQDASKDIPVLFSAPLFQSSPLLTLTLCVKKFTGRFATLARETALNHITTVLQANTEATDYQALLPHVLTALSDPSQRVREAASRTLLSVCEHIRRTQKKDKNSKIWGPNGIYGERTDSVKWLSTEESKKFVEKVLSGGLEECVMDPNHVFRAVVKSISGLKSALKRSVMAYLTSHVLCAPGALFKERVLGILTPVKSSSRTAALLPILSWWEETSVAEREELLAKENVQMETFQNLVVETVDTSDRGDGVNVLLKIMAKEGESQAFVKAAGRRLLELCGRSISDESKAYIARKLMVLALGGEEGSGEAIEILRRIVIPDSVYVEFLLDTRKAPEASEGGDHRPKRRRTSSAEEERSQTSQGLTLVLELLEGENPVDHIELLGPLFNVLGYILKNVEGKVGGRDYLIQVLLSCLSGIVSTLKTKKNVKLDNNSVRADLLVSCIRSTINPQIQNSALLLVAALAEVIPDVILHSVMPIFTFMGASTLKHDDEYSAHVIEQTITKVIPPLVRSFYLDGTNPVIGSADLLNSFVAAFGHIPAHRRLKLFTALTRTLGTEEFLFAVLCMLAEKYHEEKEHVRSDEAVVREFCVGFAGMFGAVSQVGAVTKVLKTVLESRAESPSAVSVQLLKTKDKSADECLELIGSVIEVVQLILSARKLRAIVGKVFKDEGGDAAGELRASCTGCMEVILQLENTLGDADEDHSINLRPLLKALLELLPTTDFVDVVDKLLQNTDLELRNQALSAFKDRIATESKANIVSRTAIMSLASKVASSITSPDAEVDFKANVLSCVDAVVVKFGSQEGDIVSRLGEVILGDAALRNSEKDIYVLSLVCLTSIAKCLNGRMIPFLPKLFPYTLDLLEKSISNEQKSWDVHNAILVLLEALVSVIPNFMTTYVERILKLSFASANAEDDDDDEDSDDEESDSEDEDDDGKQQRAIANTLRNDLYAKIAEKMDAKKLFTALNTTWSTAFEKGILAISESLSLLLKCVGYATKSTVISSAGILLRFFEQAMDVRRVSLSKFDGEEVLSSEEQMFKVAIQVVFKLNDTTFRPMFSRLLEWASDDMKGKGDEVGRRKRLRTFYGFFDSLIKRLGSLVTSYYASVLDYSIELLDTLKSETADESLDLWEVIIKSLTGSFATDQNEFWQSPATFDRISPCLLSQLTNASTLPIERVVIPAITELAVAAQSEEHFKAINSAVLKHMRSDDAAVRMAAVKMATELYDKLGEDWLSLLPETVPIIAELMEDDDEDVERATQRLIVKIEGFLGESLDTMLT